MHVMFRKDKYEVYLPTLSDLSLNAKYILPGAVKLKLDLDKDGYFKTAHLEQLLPGDKICTVSETNIDFNFPHKFLTADNILSNNSPLLEKNITNNKTKRLNIY